MPNNGSAPVDRSRSSSPAPPPLKSPEHWAATMERKAWCAALNLDPGTTAEEALEVLKRRIADGERMPWDPL